MKGLIDEFNFQPLNCWKKFVKGHYIAGKIKIRTTWDITHFNTKLAYYKFTSQYYEKNRGVIKNYNNFSKAWEQYWAKKRDFKNGLAQHHDYLLFMSLEIENNVIQISLILCIENLPHSSNLPAQKNH